MKAQLSGRGTEEVRCNLDPLQIKMNKLLYGGTGETFILIEMDRFNDIIDVDGSNQNVNHSADPHKLVIGDAS